MQHEGYKIRDPQGVYFITFATVQWVDWRQDNQPVQLESVSFTLSKLNCLHNNPVKAGWMEKPEDYLLNSARDYAGGKGLLPVAHLTAARTLKT